MTISFFGLPNSLTELNAALPKTNFDLKKMQDPHISSRVKANSAAQNTMACEADTLNGNIIEMVFSTAYRQQRCYRDPEEKTA